MSGMCLQREPPPRRPRRSAPLQRGWAPPFVEAPIPLHSDGPIGPSRLRSDPVGAAVHGRRARVAPVAPSRLRQSVGGSVQTRGPRPRPRRCARALRGRGPGGPVTSASVSRWVGTDARSAPAPPALCTCAARAWPRWRGPRSPADSSELGPEGGTVARAPPMRVTAPLCIGSAASRCACARAGSPPRPLGWPDRAPLPPPPASC